MEALSEALGFALRMEEKGRDYYLRAAEQAQDVVVRSVLVSLADDESSHAEAVGRFYTALEKHQGWPAWTPEQGTGKLPEHLQTILDETAGRAGRDRTYVGVYETARELELRSRDYYQAQADEVDDRSLVEFFRFLARVEQAHLDALTLMLDAVRRSEAG